jgi:hypothetical protein
LNSGQTAPIVKLDMGLFSKTPKPNPKLTVEGIEIEYHSDHEWWGFTYRGIEFCSFEPSLILPAKAELDALVATLESLQPEMRSRLGKGLSEWGEAKLDDGESCLVHLQDFVADKVVTVSWSDGKSWGDLGVDFTVKGQAIIDEVWGD